MGVETSKNHRNSVVIPAGSPYDLIIPRIGAIGILIRSFKQCNKDTFFRYSSMAEEYANAVHSSRDVDKCLRLQLKRVREQNDPKSRETIPTCFCTLAGLTDHPITSWAFIWRTKVKHRKEDPNSSYHHGIVYVAHCDYGKSFTYIINDYKNLKEESNINNDPHFRYINEIDFPIFLVVIETDYNKYKKYNKDKRNYKYREYFLRFVGDNCVADIPTFQESFAMMDRKRYRRLQLSDPVALAARYLELAKKLSSFHQSVLNSAFRIDLQRSHQFFFQNNISQFWQICPNHEFQDDQSNIRYRTNGADSFNFKLKLLFHNHQNHHQ